MRKTVRGMYFGVVLMLVAGISFAQVPDFSGEWNLNINKSELPAMGEPEGASLSVPEMAWTIRQEGFVLTVEKRVKGEVMIRRYTADGKEFLNAGSSIKDLKGTARFNSGKLTIQTEDEVMTVTYTSAYPDGNIEYSRIMVAEEYSLSADGKTLMVTQIFGTPDGGSKSMKLVFEKVGG
jgi:hypothetical protein